MFLFPKRLKELREKRGLSQEDLADKLNIPRSSLANYESEDNDRTPRRKRLEEIADLFDVSVDYLLGRDDSTYIESTPDEFKEIISKFENIEEIIKDYYLIRFNDMYKDIFDYIDKEKLFIKDRLNETFDYSQYDDFETPEDVYLSLSLNFKIQYLQAMIIDAKIKNLTFEDYLTSYNVTFKYKQVRTNEIDNAANQVDIMLKRTHEYLQAIGRGSRINSDKGFFEDASIIQIPIYGEIKAGYDFVAEQNIIGYKIVSKKEVSDGEYFYLVVKGDSMIDEGIRDGFNVLVKKQSFVENGKIGVVIINGDEATLKRVYYDGLNVILQASNKEIPPRVIPVNEVMIQGQVKSVVFDV
ncbi:helix-turn-helix domain-containing protein [Paenibacillus sp. N1-5-1-14]|uniref:helix-turn-helix domain-containing protein n=1 Tax=Paenibacillus radicibacter TaxID=2972488 RepID=UPI0021598CAB|nr:S24 family peptidase [Paenibacillus radicibacter]MCR8641483.1 helix-turn-helix domain-containing protein [Paenibacillus radicibacter]